MPLTAPALRPSRETVAGAVAAHEQLVPTGTPPAGGWRRPSPQPAAARPTEDAATVGPPSDGTAPARTRSPSASTARPTAVKTPPNPNPCRFAGFRDLPVNRRLLRSSHSWRVAATAPVTPEVAGSSPVAPVAARCR